MVWPVLNNACPWVPAFQLSSSPEKQDICQDIGWGENYQQQAENWILNCTPDSQYLFCLLHINTVKVSGVPYTPPGFWLLSPEKIILPDKFSTILTPSAFHPVIKPTFTWAQWVWEHTLMPELLLWLDRPRSFTCCFSLDNVWTSLGIKTPIWKSGWASLLLASSYCVGSVCASDLITYSCPYRNIH